MPSVSSFIRARKWEKVSDLLCRECPYQDTPKRFICCMECEKRHNILHYILGFNPPVSIVQDVITAFPDTVHEMDCMHRYPLHISLMCGASSDLIRYLIKVNEEAVTAVDKEGKTTMHLLFTDYRMRRKSNSKYVKELRGHFPTIIHMLCHEHPELILKEDLDDVNVIELVVLEEVDQKMMKLLQSIAECAMKGKDLSWFREPKPRIKKLEVKPDLPTGLVKIVASVGKTFVGRSA